ncbi:hypothetical protein RND71_022703 [Anisodus tanguticus]|uniref:S-protein homolog n=1 Tax=Anisodus tanguticus TaxID=243964 RepID=A0AAE1RUC4_9SOLA|nr:hypothetical protein RND71_022703 [Anisodus tanguticus]
MAQKCESPNSQRRGALYELCDLPKMAKGNKATTSIPNRNLEGMKAPNIVEARCYVHGEDHGKFSIKPGWTNQFYESIDSGKNNTLSCDLKLGEKHGVFGLFNLNATNVCHTTDVTCNWKIREDGLCMLLAGKCVMFKWDTTLSIRHIASEPIPTKYIESEPIIWERTP